MIREAPHQTKSGLGIVGEEPRERLLQWRGRVVAEKILNTDIIEVDATEPDLREKRVERPALRRRSFLLRN